jgi:nucleoside triphosphate pyrophosphatase
MKIPSKPLIYLASASPRRSALLSQIGVAHRVRPVSADERALPGEEPARYVRRLALLKAQTLWRELDAAERLPVLGADTAVATDAEILGKPADESDCLRMLRALSGRTHQVFTAVALCSDNGEAAKVSVNDVTFRALSQEEMRAYWASGEPADKAGAYAVQGLAAAFIERIAGSYSGVMGLPLFETAQLLSSIGWSLRSAEPMAGSRDAAASVHEARG